MAKENINIRVLKLIGKGVSKTSKGLISVSKKTGKTVKKYPISTIAGGSGLAYANSDLMEYPDKQRAKIMLENHRKGI